MRWVVDLEAQQISRLNEHFLIVDRIRKARRSARQGNDWLRNKMLNPSGDDTPVPPPSINSEGGTLTKQFVGPQVQNERDTQYEMGIPSPESSPLQNPDHGSKAPTVLVTLGGSTQRLLPGKTNETA